MFRKTKEEQQQQVVISLDPKTQKTLLALEKDTDTLAQMVVELIAQQKRIVELLQAQLNGSAPESADPSLADPNRRRATAFERRPRDEQVAWLTEGPLADGKWHTAYDLANKYGENAAQKRYLRGAISGRLREMWHDGLAERRESNRRGAMYEYRLKP
jgi:hypothetical protein